MVSFTTKGQYGYKILSQRIVAWFVLFVATCMAGGVTMAVLNSHVRTTSTTTVASQVTTSAALTNSTTTTIITQTTIATPIKSTTTTTAMLTTTPATPSMLYLSTYNSRNEFQVWSSSLIHLLNLV